MKFKLSVEYDGTRYSGWQKQKNSRTVQGELIKAAENALSSVKASGKFIDLQGAGRTDAGVHALEQIAHLECDTMLAPHILQLKINDALPSDINILDVSRTKDSFHARHSAVARQYIYRISRRRSAFDKKYIWWVKDELDFSAMSKCLNVFMGRKDFASFSDRSDDDKSTIAEVEDVELIEEDDLIIFRIRASHFLWKMVRRITGVLVETGRGNFDLTHIESFLNTYSDIPAKYTAPPSGLFLEKVYY